MRAIEKICGNQISRVLAQLMLSEGSYDGADTVWRDKEEKNAADYFERAINAFGNYAEIEEKMNALKRLFWTQLIAHSHLDQRSLSAATEARSIDGTGSGALAAAGRKAWFGLIS